MSASTGVFGLPSEMGVAERPRREKRERVAAPPRRKPATAQADRPAAPSPLGLLWDDPDVANAAASTLYGLATVALLYAALFLAIHLPVFALSEVRVTGDFRHLSRLQIEEAVVHRVRGNFFTVDLEATRQVFEKLPWVRQVSVRRHWPERLTVDIEEHQPLARWADGTLVNSHGELFEGASDDPMPTFIGPAGGAREMTRQYARLAAAVQPLGRRVDELQLTSRGSWQLRLDDGMVLALGREHMEERMARFVAAYDKAIRPLNRHITYVDLRYPNGFAVRVPGLGGGGDGAQSKGQGA